MDGGCGINSVKCGQTFKITHILLVLRKTVYYLLKDVIKGRKLEECRRD